MPKIAIIGTTTWGETLGIVLAHKGLQVKLWARTEQEAAELANAGPNPSLLPGVIFPPQLSITSSLDEALDNAKAAISSGDINKIETWIGKKLDERLKTWLIARLQKEKW